MSNDGYNEEMPDHPSPDLTGRNERIPPRLSPSQPGGGYQPGQNPQLSPSRPFDPSSQPIGSAYPPMLPYDPSSQSYDPATGQPSNPNYPYTAQPLPPYDYQQPLSPASPYDASSYQQPIFHNSPPPPPYRPSRRVFIAGIGALGAIVLTAILLFFILMPPHGSTVDTRQQTPLTIIVTATIDPNATAVPAGQPTPMPILVSVTTTPTASSTSGASPTSNSTDATATPKPNQTQTPSGQPTTTPVSVSGTLTPVPTNTSVPPTATSVPPTATPTPTKVLASVMGTGQNQFDYNTRWQDDKSGEYYSDGTGIPIIGTPDSVSFRFTGSRIQLVSSLRDDFGIASVTIKSATSIISQKNVDLWLNSSTFSLPEVVYDSASLPEGSYTLTLKVTGTADSSCQRRKGDSCTFVGVIAVFVYP